MLLRPKPDSQNHGLGRIFGEFNRFLDWVQERYGQALNLLIRLKGLVLGLFVASLGLTYWMYTTVPTAFLPDEDQGYFIHIIQAPEGVGLNYTSDVMRKVEEILLPLPEVRATFAVGGFGFGSNTANRGVVFTTLIPWSERTQPSESALAIIERVQGQLAQITEARVLPVNPPAIQGLGSFGGFQFQLQDQRGTFTLDQLVQSMGQLLGAANQHPNLQAVSSTYSANTPQFEIEVNRRQAKAVGVEIDEIFNTLQAYLGSRYGNDFTLSRRTYRVYVQADQQFRSNPEDIGKLYVRSNHGEMVSLNNLVTVRPVTGAQTINHYNLFRSKSTVARLLDPALVNLFRPCKRLQLRFYRLAWDMSGRERR